MEHFIARYRPFVTAVLSGSDRLVFRGTMLPLVIKPWSQSYYWSALSERMGH